VNPKKQSNKKDRSDYIEMFVLSSIVGFLVEFIGGWGIYALLGQFLWVYPTSPLKTSSLIVIPLWGIIGLIFLYVWKYVKKHDIF
jgi:uncharacterized membrane protein